MSSTTTTTLRFESDVKPTSPESPSNNVLHSSVTSSSAPKEGLMTSSHTSESVSNPALFLFWEARRWFYGFLRLFFTPKFIIHRVQGFLFLLQYFVSLGWYFYDYPSWMQSPLPYTLPVTGVLQTVSAIYIFTFLPKRNTDPGYYSDYQSMTYPFICENLFFTLILCFQWLYYNDLFYGVFQNVFTFECIMVFLPYLFRPLFPKTHFRDALSNTKKKNNDFYFYLTWVTKIFYMWAKHYIGFFLNYIRFLNKVSAEDQRNMMLLLLSSSFATTIAMFLHTLRFKGYLPPRVTFSIYVLSYLSTFYSYVKMSHVFVEYPLLFLVTFVGMVVNYFHFRLFDLYQVGVMAWLCYVKYQPVAQ